MGLSRRMEVCSAGTRQTVFCLLFENKRSVMATFVLMICSWRSSGVWKGHGLVAGNGGFSRSALQVAARWKDANYWHPVRTNTFLIQIWVKWRFLINKEALKHGGRWAAALSEDVTDGFTPLCPPTASLVMTTPWKTFSQTHQLFRIFHKTEGIKWLWALFGSLSEFKVFFF